MPNKTFPLYDTIYTLRVEEEIILTDKILKISTEDEIKTIAFLKEEYEKEKLNYPFSAPVFNEQAALWASKIIYFSAQLYLNRTDTYKKVDELILNYKGNFHNSTYLSADLCLRFLQDFIFEFKNVDAQDPIIPKLMSIAEKFHYSMIGYELDYEKLNFDEIFKNNSLKQMYLDRIVEKKAINLAKNEKIQPLLLENFGDYRSHFWREL